MVYADERFGRVWRGSHSLIRKMFARARLFRKKDILPFLNRQPEVI
jgi:hypothetical protein